MKVIIQIPCKDEEQTLALVISQLPKQIDGIDTIKYQIIDDGSTDNTVQIAEKLGVHNIISFTKNKWLWAAFKAGLDYARTHDADILINTDWDNQYPWSYISALIQPILLWHADIVIGDRNPTQIAHFSYTKRIFQYIGNAIVGMIIWIKTKDSTSWFRAYNKKAIHNLQINSTFSYVMDTLVQAHAQWLRIQRIPITTNLPTRPSRLFSNIFQYILKTGKDLITSRIRHSKIPSIFRKK